MMPENPTKTVIAGTVVALCLASQAGCSNECEPIRCPTTPPVLLTVVDEVTGVKLLDATVKADGETAVVSQNWCNLGYVPCTHSVNDIPSAADKKRTGGPEPGYGPFEPDVDLEAMIDVDAKDKLSARRTVQLSSDGCGSVKPEHFTVRLSASSEGIWVRNNPPSLRICTSE